MTLDSVNGVGGVNPIPSPTGANTTRAGAPGEIPIGRANPTASSYGVEQQSVKNFQRSGFAITEEDVAKARKADGKGSWNRGFLRSDKKAEFVQIRNEAAKKIYDIMSGNNIPDDVFQMGANFIKAMPMYAANSAVADFKTQCEQQVTNFLNYCNAQGLAELIALADNNNEKRFNKTLQGLADLGVRINDLGDKIDNMSAELKQEIQDGTAKVIQQVKVENGKTRVLIQRATGEIIQGVTQNMSAIVGVDAEGFTVTTDEGDRQLTNGKTIADTDSAVGQINANTHTEILKQTLELENYMDDRTAEIKEHVTTEHETTREVVRKEGEKTRANQNENAQLLAKRQTLSDMLNEEITGLQTGGGLFPFNQLRTGGIYRDSTITWLGDTADKVIGDSKLSPEQKEKALDELIRMVDEEFVISDGDKEDFNNTYFPKPKK